MKVLKKQAAMAASFGVACHLISPQEAGERYPLMRTDDLLGAIWLPGNGKANPANLCMSQAIGARMQGVRFEEDIEVIAVETKQGQNTGIRARRAGEEMQISSETLVNCAGQ
jgi:glycine/D-amino acid oxidase-like deaminating enzyme